MHEYTYTKKAMGTKVFVSIVSTDQVVADQLGQETMQVIDEYERMCSRFLPQSELSILNSAGSGIVSETFLTVLLRAQQLYHRTHGVFNPLVQIARLGYTKTFDDLADEHVDDTTTYSIDFDAVQIDEKRRHVTLAEGQHIDLGGCLKGYLAEHLCKKIMDHAPIIHGAIVTLGGDMYAQGTDTTGQPFICSIYNPHTQKDDITVPLHNQSLATSGTYKRRWKQGDRTVHHILDASGVKNPDTTIISASVVHADGSTAEAYAKVFLILGETKALELLNEPNLQYVLLMQDGSIHNHL